MRMLVNVICPIEPFNSMVRDGTAGEVIGKVLDEIKPESIYFTDIIFFEKIIKVMVDLDVVHQKLVRRRIDKRYLEI